jgi:hypothetical protein
MNRVLSEQFHHFGKMVACRIRGLEAAGGDLMGRGAGAAAADMAALVTAPAAIPAPAVPALVVTMGRLIAASDCSPCSGCPCSATMG